MRSDPRTFAIIDGHEIADVEDVVARHERYTVVRKRGTPEEAVAESTDPRRPID